MRLGIVEIVDLPGSQENNVKTKDVALTTPYLALNGALLHKVCLSLSSLIQRMHIVTTVDRETVIKDLKQWRPPRGQRFVKSQTIFYLEFRNSLDRSFQCTFLRTCSN